MADTILTALLLATAAATALLAHRALRHWRTERAGRVYELPVDRRGTAARAGAAGAAAVVAAALGVSLLHGGGGSGGGRGSADAAGLVPAAAAPVATPSVPPPPPRTPEPAPPAPEVHTIGHPAGGTLQQLSDGTRVWLPPLYDSRRAATLAYPVVVARVSGDAKAVFEGFARAAQKKRADLFVVAVPADCTRDDGVVLAEVARRYRTLTGPAASGLLGVGGQAPCAVREALTSDGRFGAAAGASGTYRGITATPGAHPTVLLASAAGESGARASALRLKASVAAGPDGGRRDAVRVLDALARRDVFSQVAAFMTEKLAGPTRVSAAAAVRPVPPAPAPTPTRRPYSLPQPR